LSIATGGYKIPALDSVLQKLGGNFETIFIDLKQPCPDSSLVNLANAIKKYSSYNKAITTCMNPEIIRKLKTIDPKLILGADGANNGFEDNLDECIRQKYKHIIVFYPQLDKHLCFIAHANGVNIYAYTANSEQDILKCLSYDIDGIMSDNPDLVKQTISMGIRL
jgi:glycerophosphoryl diester phosphodiesterase